MRKIFSVLLFAALWGSSGSCAEDALPFVHPIFGDNMVLQRGKTNLIWGWSKPGSIIRVQLETNTVTATAAADGRWQARIKPPAHSNSLWLRITGPQSVTFTNILLGDVWLCGGQSNMELPISRTRNAEEVIKAANHPEIRFFMVKSQPAYAPARVVHGSWKVCTPATVAQDGGLTAVGYYFACKIQRDIGVPIGLVQDCIGGTPAESWTSPETLKKLGGFDAGLAEVDRLRAKGGPQYGNYIMPWYDEFDLGQKSRGWAAPDLDDSDWKKVMIPAGGFNEFGVAATPAVCYFRKEISLPTPLPAGQAIIQLGVIEKMDTTQINGRWVGASAWVENPRAYRIPEGVLKPGRNVITVRVFKTRPNGGFQSKPADLKLVLGDKSEIALAGEWKAKLSVDARPPHPLPLGFENWPVMPAVLYQGMIAPLAPFGLTGALWYQGEANAGRAAQYRRLLPGMIEDWRKVFDQGDFPFYIVSLAAFTPHKDAPVANDAWAELRDAQAFVVRSVTNSGLAVTIDLGDANNIHPKDKKEVGERLALCALAQHYCKNVPFSGPTFDSVEKLPGALKLHFKHTDGGLVVHGDKPAEFAVAGRDGKWVWAEARLEGDSVVVSSAQVPEPEAASYAWQSNPVATLFNGAGLPAIPFRTDN
jgi:sialate O-acetylesterase